VLSGSTSTVRQKNAQEQEAMGKSRGGLSTKTHAAVDALGNPVRLLLTAGQVSEHTQAEALIGGFLAGFVLADKGYDSDAFVEIIKGGGATPVIPPRSNRKTPRDYDKDIYKERNLVERLFQKLKGYRRVATRYERLALNYMTMLSLVSILIWLK
jgi:transposase